jgi:beta-lactamase class C
MFKKAILFLFLYVICINLSFANTQKNYSQSVKTIVAQLMQQYQIPGAAVAIIDHNQSYIYTFGVADKKLGKPVTNKTIFEVGSITKLLTALLFATLHNNQSHLYDSIIKYYPELNSNKHIQEITFEKLLTYTTGLPFTLPGNITQPNQALDYLRNWGPITPIGLEWQYCNIGIGLVGMALERETHQTINQLYQKHILTPLGMAPIGTEITENFQKDFAQGYTEDGKATPRITDDNILFPSAGALKASIQDMTNFLMLAIGSPKTPRALRQAMQNTQIPRLELNNSQQGLVWQIHSLQDKNLHNEPEKMNLGPLTIKWLAKEKQIFDPNKLIDKTGATEGFRAYIAVIPAKQLGIVILLNKYISNGAIVNAGRKILLEPSEPSDKNK